MPPRLLLAIGIFSLLLWRWTDDCGSTPGAFSPWSRSWSRFRMKHTGNRLLGDRRCAVYALAKLLAIF